MKHLTFEYYLKVAKKFPNDFTFFKEKVFPVLMRWEGGGKMHNVSGDLGGWTIWGIAWNLHAKKFDYDFEFFKHLTEDEACLFAFTNYYINSKANLVPYKCRLFYVDMAYNMGVKQAVKIIQSCIGVRVDGIFGRETISHIHKAELYCLKQLRDERYRYLTTVRPINKKFLRGWLNRSNNVYRIIV
ncbi:MAG: hypothetical protein KGV59_01425 [Tenacibaculum sp.]|nr:hypothetical protein [Tenacibaculum sp.]